MFFSPNLAASLPNMEFTGWGHGIAIAEPEEGSSELSGSMTETAVAPRSPRHQHKRHRLSRLLDRLTVQIRNNNHYMSPRWVMFNAFHEQADTTEDVPLDLSKKPKPKAHAVREKEAFSCGTCGQTFAVNDRLAKHIASRHRNRTPDAHRQYHCEICNRRFARSDMLTRHARLHSGVKPYECPVCEQVFSRSDHLATHQRTHTGEKPYRCPMCPYAACRRDMITRHMRTHNKKDNA